MGPLSFVVPKLEFIGHMITNDCPVQVLPSIHLEAPHEIRKRSLDQQLRIKLYYDESVYR